MKTYKETQEDFLVLLRKLVAIGMETGLASLLIEELEYHWGRAGDDPWTQEYDGNESDFLFGLLTMVYDVHELSDVEIDTVAQNLDRMSRGRELQFELLSVTGDKEKAAKAFGHCLAVVDYKVEGITIAPV